MKRGCRPGHFISQTFSFGSWKLTVFFFKTIMFLSLFSASPAVWSTVCGFQWVQTFEMSWEEFLFSVGFHRSGSRLETHEERARHPKVSWNRPPPHLTSADKHYHALNPDEVQAHTWIGHSSSSFCIKDCIADCCTAVQNSTFCSGAAADPQRSDSTTRAPVCASQGARMFSRQEPLTQQTKRGR